MTEPYKDHNTESDLREMFERFQGPDSPSPVRRQKRRFALSLALAAFLLVGAGVVSIAFFGNRYEHSRPATGSSTAGVCVATVKYEGRRYIGSTRDSPQHGELLGTGIIPGCHDQIVTELSSDGTTITTYTDGIDDESVNVYSVVGVDPADAVKIDGDGGIYFSEAISPSLSNNMSSEHCWDHEEDIRAILSCVKSGS
jgi:hypothetical protein